MIPFRDHTHSRRFPIITVLLIAINVVVWLYQWTLNLGGQLEPFVYGWAVIPYNLVTNPTPRTLLTIFTAMFLHGSWMHILGNMLYLWIFGDNVEEALGRLRYFLFYLASGIVATLLQVMVGPASQIPNLGASGAIAGVLGGYLLLFPRARIDTLIFLGIFIRIITLPALVVLGFWFVIQLFGGLGSLEVVTSRGGVAYFAHVGGFAAGLLLMAFFRATGSAHRHDRA
jgi:membrane associated rhomboid family serine protease